MSSVDERESDRSRTIVRSARDDANTWHQFFSSLNYLDRMVFNRFAAFAVLVLAFSAAHTAVAQPWATKMFGVTHHDFGTVSRNAKTEFLFEIENVYEQDVHIASVRSSCGCTSARVLKNTLKSWEKGGIVAEFNTTSFIGHKSAALTVVIDRPYYAEMQLLVTGVIRSDIVTEPGQVDFGTVNIGEDREQMIRIAYAGRPNWTVKDVRGNSDNLEVRIKNIERKGNATTYWLNVKLLPTAPVGMTTDEIVIVTDDSVNDHFTIPVSARVAPAIEIAPAIVDLGPLAPNAAAQQRFIVKGKTPFKITDITSADSRLSFRHDGGTKAVHVVTIDALVGDAVSDINCDVQIQSDLNPQVASSVKIIGQLRR